MSHDVDGNSKTGTPDGRARQFATFYLGDRLYGIDVMQVQEVTQALPLTVIRLAPPFVKGLINLRGQIATAIGLRELFELGTATNEEQMTVVCRTGDALLSLLVDRIGDVVEVSESDFESPPDTIDSGLRRFMQGIYKTDKALLSVIGIENISKEISSKNQSEIA
jgi:purine-binding chemotaxis protein CheW